MMDVISVTKKNMNIASQKISTGTVLRNADVVAEWSKALALGASPKGRGFEPHRHHPIGILFFIVFSRWPLSYALSQTDIRVSL